MEIDVLFNQTDKMTRKILLLTEGFTNPHTAKTARNLIIYKPEEVAGVIDSTNVGNNAGVLLETGGDYPIFPSVESAPEADHLLIGIATPGGLLPEGLRQPVITAIRRGMNIISGLHHYLSDDPEFSALANDYNVKLIDLRKNTFNRVANRTGIREDVLRVHTVGNDCSLGKMVVSLNVSNELIKLGYDSCFVATGQTGMLISGGGLPIDNIKGDYINGAAESLVLDNQNHDILMIEGQGSLVHPRYSSVTLGLLHGSQPHGLIMCYELGREYIHGVDGFKIPDMETVIDLYLKAANIMHSCEIIGFAINSRKSTKAEADYERDKMFDKYGLPVCDVVRHGAGELAEGIISFKDKLGLPF